MLEPIRRAAGLGLLLVISCYADEEVRFPPPFPWGLRDFSYFILSDGNGYFGEVVLTQQQEDDGTFTLYVGTTGIFRDEETTIPEWFVRARIEPSSIQDDLTFPVLPRGEDGDVNVGEAGVFSMSDDGARIEAEGGQLRLAIDPCAETIEGEAVVVPAELNAVFYGHLRVDRSDGAFAWCDD